MTLQVNHIQRAADGGAYQVFLDVDGAPYVFVVRVQRGPVFAISAPHSFWLACAEHDIDPQSVLELVQRTDAGEPMAWPLALSTTTGQGAGPQKLWGAKLGCRLPPESLRRAIGYYERRSDTTLFPKAFEYSIIRECWDDLHDAVSSVDLLGHGMTDFRQLIAPKASGGTRIATQLDPLDNILLTACVYELGSAFEAARVPADAGVVHSYRYQGGDEHLWDRRYSYGSFLARAKELSEASSTRFVAEADISSFYHRVPIEVAAHSLERAGAARKLLEGVCRMFLSFSNIGLPVGPPSSGLFAEAVLNEVDMALLLAGANFVRYSDDYRFFCKSEVEARSHLQLLSELLNQKAGLTLHDTKTQIWDVVNYQKHLETKDAWLGDLREHMLARDPKYGDPEPEELDDHERGLLAKAHDLLKQALDEQHAAWLHRCRIALEALPLRERLDMLPGLLAQFGRLKPMARELSHSMTLFGRRRPSQREDLVGDVVNGIVNDQGRNSPDFARMWITHPFERGDWPALEELIAIPKRWPADRAARRQIVLALQHDPRLAEEIEIDPSDNWQRRAALRVLGTTAIRRRDSETDRDRWNTLLDAVIADTAVRSEPYDEH